MIVQYPKRKNILFDLATITVPVVDYKVLNLIISRTFLMIIYLNAGRMDGNIRITVILRHLEISGKYCFRYWLEGIRHFTILIVRGNHTDRFQVEVSYLFFQHLFL